MTWQVPVAVPDLSGNEEKYVSDAVRSTWISSSGEYLSRFESEFAGLCGVGHAIGVANGTVALHLALMALDVGPGDEVIVPSLTYISSVNAIRYVGATPVFVDIDEATWCLDPAEVERRITPRTKAIIVVHLYGQPADMDEITAIAGAHDLRVVEDAAEAPLASYRGRPTGSLGDIATFSFYGNKVLTSGEGGAVTTADPELHRRMHLLRGQGMDPQRRYYFPIVGYNYRLTNIAGALLCAQLERRVELLESRREIYRWYDDLLGGVAGITLQQRLEDRELCPWLYSVLVDESEFGHSRDELMTLLGARGIETRPFFPPVHHLPPYVEDARAQGADLPVTDRLAASGVNLPTFSGMSVDQVELVGRSIGELAGGRS